MTDAIAAFEIAYRNWLHHNNFQEGPTSTTQDTTRNIILDRHGTPRGAIIHTQTTQGKPKLRLGANDHDTQHLKIDKLTYLSIQEDYQITVMTKKGRKCWLNHTRDMTDTCTTCLAAKHNLRCVREAGRIWLLTNFLADIKHLIAQQLSQLALPDNPPS